MERPETVAQHGTMEQGKGQTWRLSCTVTEHSRGITYHGSPGSCHVIFGVIYYLPSAEYVRPQSCSRVKLLRVESALLKTFSMAETEKHLRVSVQTPDRLLTHKLIVPRSESQPQKPCSGSEGRVKKRIIKDNAIVQSMRKIL